MLLSGGVAFEPLFPELAFTKSTFESRWRIVSTSASAHRIGAILVCRAMLRLL
jgi:hypothetical protein